ncbi:hypothetical protein CEUSTIGMA_g8621.t1 [Chlamydomonas eustigma]|uniref:Uncharacterized protein n=1 Tax=Chlamydomonas eustigma TaxID=1157962 RepID=A0A250XDM2_9CHLO|nr:hypothetical protein CEUSTIGMA_g8621.t1 [Chlamydomonas eustigma]|eukprot:GAX81188.1 hypothetical protein CEUSTIGMA_g8621.t1 [Chlamydomonas eustigma]
MVLNKKRLLMLSPSQTSTSTPAAPALFRVKGCRKASSVNAMLNTDMPTIRRTSVKRCLSDDFEEAKVSVRNKELTSLSRKMQCRSWGSVILAPPSRSKMFGAEMHYHSKQPDSCSIVCQLSQNLNRLTLGQQAKA